MKFRKFFAGAAAVSLALAPLAANARPADHLSVTKTVRASASGDKASDLLGGGTFVAVISAIAIILGIIIVANEDDAPDSP